MNELQDMEAEKVTILIADDDEGHLILVQDTLRSGGLDNPMLTFRDGQEVLDFLHGVHPRHRFDPDTSHLFVAGYPDAQAGRCPNPEPHQK